MNPYEKIHGVFSSPKKSNASTPFQNKGTKVRKLRPLDEMACRMCGQTEGLKAYHYEDYTDPIGDATPLCWRCHMLWHSRFRVPQAVFKYIYEVVVLRKQYPPIHKPNLGILRRDHGI